MRLHSFRIQNFKSIRDSGTCFFSDVDNILAVAGQNESGKSAVLEGLQAFDEVSLDPKCICRTAEDEVYPSIHCSFSIKSEEAKTIVDDVENDEETSALEKSLVKFSVNSLKVELVREYNSHKESYIDYNQTYKKFLTAKIAELYPEEQEEALGLALGNAALWLYGYTPQILYFNDITGQLPERMAIADIQSKSDSIPGKQAVRNLEKLLRTDFSKFNKQHDAKRVTFEKSLSEKFTADFNEVWKQRVIKDNKVTIKIRYEQGGADGTPYISFYILSDGETYLTPDQRSRGFLWFLSFYLELKARSSTNTGLLILFDEPGLFLHAKAQKDILSLFEELGAKDQIIYSTHSPYLLPPDKIYRIVLTINTKESGTTIEKITTGKYSDRLDAMQPVRDAIGLDVAHQLGCSYKNNIICEGITDFYYISALKALLCPTGDFAIIPSMGANNMHLLAELCVGWGLQWFCIFDSDKTGERAANSLISSFALTPEEVQTHIAYIPKSGIEEVVGAGVLLGDKQDEKHKDIYELIQHHGGKELVARKFMAGVQSGNIIRDQLAPSTIDFFEPFFAMICHSFDSDC